MAERKSGGTDGVGKSASVASKKPAKSAGAAAKKPAKGAGAAAKKPAKGAGAAAKSAAAKSTAARTPAGSSAAKSSGVKSTGVKKPTRSTAVKKPAGGSGAKKPDKSTATIKPSRGAGTAAKASADASPAAKASADASPAAGKAASAAAEGVVSAAGLAKAAKAARGARKPPDAPARTPGQAATVESTARTYFEALTARDAVAAAKLWDKGGVQDLVPIGIFRGPAAIEQFFREMFTAMPDLRFDVERITADEGVAAVQWRLAGTFSAGSFQGLEPNGRRVELRGTDCLEIDDGRIMRNTAVFDGAAFARQVGLLPAEDSGADRAMRAGFNTVTKLRRSVARRTTG